MMSSSSSTMTTSRPQQVERQDTTRLVSEHPNHHIVCSDRRYPNAPCFLYLPHGSPDFKLVFVDYLHAIQAVARWSVWDNQDRSPTTFPRPPPLFSLRADSWQGIGMFASRKIRAGEVIHSERPLYVTTNPFLHAEDQNDENGVFYEAALRDLSSASQRAILGLKNSYPPHTYHNIPGILNTNCLAISVEGFPDGTYVACFPTLSRVNHDCTPSAHYFFNFRDFEGQLRAVRNIAKGEEITITYADPLLTRAERRSFLWEKRFFTCGCASCSLSAGNFAARQSDERRSLVKELLSYIEKEPPPPVEPFKLWDALQKAEDEGLVVERARILSAGSQVLTMYNLPEYADQASQWARDARTLFLQLEGSTSEHVKRLNKAIGIHGGVAAGTLQTLQWGREAGAV